LAPARAPRGHPRAHPRLLRAGGARRDDGSGEGKVNAVAAEDVRVFGRRGKAIGEEHAQAALAPRVGQRLEHLARGPGEGIEGRRAVLVVERDVAAARGERDPDWRLAAAAMAVLHRVEEELLDHKVRLEALVARHLRLAAEALDELPRLLPFFEAGVKHRYSGCDGVHRRFSMVWAL